MRSSGKIGLWIVLAVLLIASSAAMNIYLMGHRPTVDRNDNDENQLCGRVNGPVYCVKLTNSDVKIYSILVTSATIAGLPALLCVMLLLTGGKRD